MVKNCIITKGNYTQHDYSVVTYQLQFSKEVYFAIIHQWSKIHIFFLQLSYSTIAKMVKKTKQKNKKIIKRYINLLCWCWWFIFFRRWWLLFIVVDKLFYFVKC